MDGYTLGAELGPVCTFTSPQFENIMSQGHKSRNHVGFHGRLTHILN